METALVLEPYYWINWFVKLIVPLLHFMVFIYYFPKGFNIDMVQRNLEFEMEL